MKEIAKFLSIKPASATSLINDLAREGFLERIADSKDRRIIRLKITKSGREKIEENLRHSKKGLKEVFSKLEERDRENLIKIFNKLSSILSSNLN